MDKMTIGYFADGPWSHDAFEKLIKNENFDIKFIVPRNDTTDDTLKNYAQKHNIDYLFPVSINTPEFLELVKKYDCDLFVSMSFNQIFKKEILSIPRFGVINCHAGKLPFYRGRNILNWALINDEDEFGITVHFVDEGIDTGDIILQKTYPIVDTDTYKTLLEKAFTACGDILYEAVENIYNNNYQRINQLTIHPVGFYCGRRTIGDEIINWHQTSRELFNFVRAICAPGPMATTFFKNEEVKINGARLIEEAPCYKGTVGQLIAKTKDGYLVKTLDSFIEIYDIETSVKLSVGSKFLKFKDLTL